MTHVVCIREGEKATPTFKLSSLRNIIYLKNASVLRKYLTATRHISPVWLSLPLTSLSAGKNNNSNTKRINTGVICLVLTAIKRQRWFPNPAPPPPPSSDSPLPKASLAEWRVSRRLLSGRREQLDNRVRDKDEAHTLTLSCERKKAGIHNTWDKCTVGRMKTAVCGSPYYFCTFMSYFSNQKWKQDAVKSFIFLDESLQVPNHTTHTPLFPPFSSLLSAILTQNCSPPACFDFIFIFFTIPSARWQVHWRRRVMEVFNRLIITQTGGYEFTVNNWARREKKKRKESKTKLQPLIFALIVNRATSRCFAFEAQMLIIEKIAHSQIRVDRKWENWMKSP